MAREDSHKKARDEKETTATAEAVAADIAAAESAVEEQVKKLSAEKQDLTNTLVRLQADFDNYRKRVERERHQERQRGAETLVERLLPVLDAFDRAIAAHTGDADDEFRKGFELIRKQLADALTKQGLERIDTEGKAFDPHVHHAIERVETHDQPDGAVLGVLQAGYSYHGKVLRPAMVRVAVNRTDEETEGAQE
ncbi:MAG TPA: nucleotide exchange factor GrpE [Candidatus Acidoferrales bacterium]|nr:nucleotide exchange factor GrpE [Candidatus Acidoferrales bacterium]